MLFGRKKPQPETGVKVGDLMTRNFIWVSSDADLEKSARLMLKKRVGSLIVKDGDKLKGILTEKDIVWVVLKKSKSDLSGILVKDVMRRKVVSIKPSADIMEALSKMKKKKIRRLPVVENNKVIGMLTVNDILRIDPTLFAMISENQKIREESEKLKHRKTMRKVAKCEECGETDLVSRDGELWLCQRCYDAK
ncbi:MAG: CBS domain-containing protein [archaeon]